MSSKTCQCFRTTGGVGSSPYTHLLTGQPQVYFFQGWAQGWGEQGITVAALGSPALTSDLCKAPGDRWPTGTGPPSLTLSFLTHLGRGATVDAQPPELRVFLPRSGNCSSTLRAQPCLAHPPWILTCCGEGGLNTSTSPGVRWVYLFTLKAAQGIFNQNKKPHANSRLRLGKPEVCWMPQLPYR